MIEKVWNKACCIVVKVDVFASKVSRADGEDNHEVDLLAVDILFREVLSDDFNGCNRKGWFSGSMETLHKFFASKSQSMAPTT